MISNDAIEQYLIEERSKEDKFRNAVLEDFWICCVSREASILGRREVLTGKAKFGILGDGKEVPQVALAKSFRYGDWRSGYYRDQTWMFALGISTVEQFFAQIYADSENDPFSRGRQMNSHFATPIIDRNGHWLPATDRYNISSDVSPTGGQMARAVGLGLASRLYRNGLGPENAELFSEHGNEVCFCSIGDASTSEGIFWESLNAAGVLKIPLAISVWDDGYGISVPRNLQTTKDSISKILEGFLIDENRDGILLYTGKAWDYPGLCAMYERGIRRAREEHLPVVFHIQECTQPQGHSTSGSHERYKSQERLQWEDDVDCIKVMGEWMIESGLATEEKIDEIRSEAKKYARQCKNRAWKQYYEPVKSKRTYLISLYDTIAGSEVMNAEIRQCREELDHMLDPLMSELYANGKHLKYALHKQGLQDYGPLNSFLEEIETLAHQRYHTDLYSDTPNSALKIPVEPARYSKDSPLINGYQVLNRCFEYQLKNKPEVVAFGEDLGKIGDVNQAFAGLQEKFGAERVTDTGIREWSIVGQAIGLAMRGFRPIAEIQYLDYLIYGLEPLSDDLATLRYRSGGIQAAPAIIRTRGHRLEGIWHAGSPLGMVINALRGMYICTPRNMTQAAGMYNTLLQSDDPALVIECLNGYRLKERLPDNISTFTVPLGVPEILKEGSDVTLVTYGSCVRVAEKAIEILEAYDISVELIDVQTLVPFDLEGVVSHSLRKTNRIIFLDEDVPGGATAYMLREVLERQQGYNLLDSMPRCVSAEAHRPPYGSDGDYFSKPNPEKVFEAVYDMMHESNPAAFPGL